MGVLQARILEWVAISFSKGSFQTIIQPGSPALQADSLPTELQGKPHRVEHQLEVLDIPQDTLATAIFS